MFLKVQFLYHCIIVNPVVSNERVELQYDRTNRRTYVAFPPDVRSSLLAMGHPTWVSKVTLCFCDEAHPSSRDIVMVVFGFRYTLPRTWRTVVTFRRSCPLQCQSSLTNTKTESCTLPSCFFKLLSHSFRKPYYHPKARKTAMVAYRWVVMFILAITEPGVPSAFVFCFLSRKV